MTDRDAVVFDDATIAAVAADADVSERSLRDVLDDQNALVRDFPGIESVDDLVYEWRTAFHEEPLVERTPEAYYLSVRPHVWADFEQRLDANEAVFDALRELHRRIFEEYGVEEGDYEPMVLIRD